MEDDGQSTGDMMAEMLRDLEDAREWLRVFTVRGDCRREYIGWHYCRENTPEKVHAKG